jgi:hypothetical protein
MRFLSAAQHRFSLRFQDFPYAGGHHSSINIEGVGHSWPILRAPILFPIYNLGAKLTENTAFNSSAIVACAAVAAIT